jgi:hypothetical protein
MYRRRIRSCHHLVSVSLLSRYWVGRPLDWLQSFFLGVAVADNSGLIKIGAIGGALFLAYRQGWLAFLGLGPAPAAPATAALAPNPNAITGANTLDGIYQRMVAAAPSGPHSIDEWDVYLKQTDNIAPPDPMPLFTAAVPGFDRSQQVTAAQYWGVMAPALKTQLGLSGLGTYGGLAALSMRYR